MGSYPHGPNPPAPCGVWIGTSEVIVRREETCDAQLEGTVPAAIGHYMWRSLRSDRSTGRVLGERAHDSRTGVCPDGDGPVERPSCRAVIHCCELGRCSRCFRIRGSQLRIRTRRA